MSPNPYLPLSKTLSAFAFLLMLPGSVPAGAGTETEKPKASPVTFSEQIVRILQENCQTCHHPGGIAPFPLGGAGRTLVGQQLGVFVSKKIQSIDVATKKVIVSDTLTPMGNLYPTLEWNISNTVTLFRNLRLVALFDAKRDFLVQNFTAYFRETQLVRSGLRIDTTALSAYERLRRFGNQTLGQPAFVTVTGKTETVSNVIDAYLEPGDFVRLRELSATYTLPQSIVSGLRGAVQGASVTVAFQNVKLWTNYSGPDPEVNSQSNPFSRQDFLTLPNPKKTVLRVNLTF